MLSGTALWDKMDLVIQVLVISFALWCWTQIVCFLHILKLVGRWWLLKFVQVVGVPVTLNGDLKNKFVETNVGFDTICRVWSNKVKMWNPIPEQEPSLSLIGFFTSAVKHWTICCYSTRAFLLISYFTKMLNTLSILSGRS